MTKATKHTLTLVKDSDRSDDYLAANACHSPVPRNAATARDLAKGIFGGDAGGELDDSIQIVKENCDAVDGGNLKPMKEILVAQAMTLDAMFTEMSRCGMLNMGEYLDASDKYYKLALKAQSQCRTTVETLDRMNRGGEQVIKHMHIDNKNGGQAIVAENVQTGGKMQKQKINPMQSAHRSPRCLAKTRKGTECQSPAVKGKKRCRMHGGTSPGAPKGNRNAWKHGYYSGETSSSAAYLMFLATR